MENNSKVNWYIKIHQDQVGKIKVVYHVIV